MSGKSFDEIMSEITAGLTGDVKEDCKYLESKMYEYRNHEYCREIIRECGRLLYNIMPEDEKEEFISAVEDDSAEFDDAIDEIKFQISKKKYVAALDLTESLIEKYEGLELYEDDMVSEYHNFDEPIQKLLYEILFKPEKKVREATTDYSIMYFLHGNILIDLKRYEDAHESLQKALKWNPVSCSIAFEDTETFKSRRLFKEYFEATQKIYKFIVYPEDLARYYRNLGYYYTEKCDYHTAACCYLFSLNFEHSDTVMSEMYYLSIKAKEMYDPDGEEVIKCFEENNIPIGPNEEVVSIAYTYGKKCFDDKMYIPARYFLNICKEYCEIEEIDSMMAVIQKNIK